MGQRRHKPHETIEQDFLDALQRIIDGRPHHPEHRALVKKRLPLKISFSSVAREAGRARGLIAKEDTKYASVRQKIFEAMEDPHTEPSSVGAANAMLRITIAELRQELKAAKDDALEAHDRWSKSERLAERYKAEAERLRAEIAKLRAKLEVSDGAAGKVHFLKSEGANEKET
ncbi:MAG: hypothetical protein CME80_17790 [Halomonas sp.]|nr:hypothetical protein [Halomonas sp.]MBF59545.1 hypothetical protein [Halomonas sp.]|tara:strand:- start:1807 stop:2325 length:519 start_codon:yes stop_codon:yes gene_type:complete